MLKRFMNTIIRSLSILCTIACIFFVAVLVIPSRGDADGKTVAVVQWMPFESLNEQVNRASFESCVEVPTLRYNMVGNDFTMTRGLKFGVSYKFTDERQNIVEWAAALINNPSEAVAKRDVYAVNFDQLSSASWRNVVEQAGFSDSENIRLTVLMHTDQGYVGTPIKWEPSSTAKIEAALKASEESGKNRNEVAKAYAARIIATSVGAFEMANEDGVAEFARQAAASSYFCGNEVGSYGHLEPVNNLYVGLSFQPDIENVTPQPLSTVSGVGGERLGVEVPSWPFAEVASE